MEKKVKIKPVNPFTRKVQREFNEILFRNARFEGGTMVTDPSNIWLANDFLAMTLCGITQDQLDNMDAKDYDELMKELGK